MGTSSAIGDIGDIGRTPAGEALEFFRKNLTGYWLEQLTGSGSSVVELQSAEASGNNPDGLPTWTVTSCIDTSGTVGVHGLTLATLAVFMCFG